MTSKRNQKIIYDHGEYVGEVKDEVPHGHGIMTTYINI